MYSRYATKERKRKRRVGQMTRPMTVEVLLSLPHLLIVLRGAGTSFAYSLSIRPANSESSV